MADSKPEKPGKDSVPPPQKESDDQAAYDELKKKLGTTKLMKADPRRLDRLVSNASKSLSPGRDTWLTEWGGKGLGHSVFDLSALLEIGGSLGNTVRWYSRSLFSGGSEIGLPGARAAVAGSLVLVLGPGLTEEPRYAGDHAFYPTVEGGRLVTATMAAANDAEHLTAIFASLSKSAARAYVNTLEVMVERELRVTTFLPQDGDVGYTTLLVEEARDDLAWLSRRPRTKTDSIEVIGKFRAVDDRGEGKFVISPEPERGKAPPADIVGKIAPDLRDQPLITRARVRATVEVTEAVETWLPRAPRTERLLTAWERYPLRRN